MQSVFLHLALFNCAVVVVFFILQFFLITFQRLLELLQFSVQMLVKFRILLCLPRIKGVQLPLSFKELPLFAGNFTPDLIDFLTKILNLRLIHLPLFGELLDNMLSLIDGICFNVQLSSHFCKVTF